MNEIHMIKLYHSFKGSFHKLFTCVSMFLLIYLFYSNLFVYWYAINAENKLGVGIIERRSLYMSK